MYIIHRRRKGATYAQILHVPPRGQDTPQLTPTPMRETFSKHPIYHDLQYSIRSSRHESTTSWPPRVRMNTSNPTGRPKHKRIESGWKDLDVPVTPTKDRDHRSTFFFDASPTVKPRVPEKAHVSVRPLSQLSHSSSTVKIPSVAETYISTDRASRTLSPLGSPPLIDDSDTRWSWTNSQAPSTPRLRPESRRLSFTSKYSAPRFRSVVSWARGQGEHIRIDEEAPPLLPTSNPASRAPTLMPVPVNKRAFKDASPPNLSGKKSTKSTTKPNGHQRAASSLGGLGGFFRSAGTSKSTNNLASSTPSFFKPSSGSKSTNNLVATPDALESGQVNTEIELKER
jgi:hypothetical protein